VIVDSEGLGVVRGVSAERFKWAPIDPKNGPAWSEYIPIPTLEGPDAPQLEFLGCALRQGTENLWLGMQFQGGTQSSIVTATGTFQGRF